MTPLADCRRCPRLVAHLDERRARHPHHHNGPVPGWGPANAPLVLVGLAPGPNGANRTGVPFHGDPSADFLRDAMAATGLFADEAPRGVFITNAVRCLPPANRPTVQEIRTCASTWMPAELQRARVVVALGRVAHDAVLRLHDRILARHPFQHGREHTLDAVPLIDSLHPSPLNTRTGRLTAAQLRTVLHRAKVLAGL